MEKKQIKKLVKKVSKNWPEYLVPQLLSDGTFRVIKRMDEKLLHQVGIHTGEDLLRITRGQTLEKYVFEKDEKIIQEFMDMIDELMKKSDPKLSIPILETYFPEIHDRIHDSVYS